MNKNKYLIVENQYFGTVNYYIILFPFLNIKIEQYDYYKKMGFRNRCIVMGSNNLIHLSVPLVNGRDHKQLMKDTRINYSGCWQAEHLRTLESCYARSPFYEHYRDDVRMLIEKKEVFLLDKNMAILEWLTKMLGIPGIISLTKSYEEAFADNVTDMRNHSMPKNYQQQPLPFTYTQVFSDRLGFQSNLCILDLLFCMGAEAKKIVQSAGMED